MPIGFDYIANEETTILIVGSMPGVASLNAQEYYAHPNNLFWKFVFEAFGQRVICPTYEEKINFILEQHIGLWDVVKSCQREGSLDTNISEAVPNNFNLLLNTYPNILKFLFNGKKAFSLFKKYYPHLLESKEYTLLPSTSPANASIPLEVKRKLWINAIKMH